MYLVLLPTIGLFTIRFNGYEILEVKKNNFPTDRPTHTGGTRSGKGKQKYFKVGLSSFLSHQVNVKNGGASFLEVLEVP